MRHPSLKGRNYRSPSGQAYTRLKYIHGSPTPKVSKFNMGDLSTHFARRVHLVSRENVQIRHNALESARGSANKVLFDKYGETGYRLRLRACMMGSRYSSSMFQKMV